MPLVCDALAYDVLAELNRLLLAQPLSHPLRKESVDGTVTVSVEGPVLLFHSAAGYSFRRLKGDVEATLRADITEPRDSLCSTFEVDDDALVPTLLERFQERHGVKMARQMDHHVFTSGGRKRIIVKLPTCMVRHMLAPTGGLMKTVVSGPVASLRAVPMVARYGSLPTEDSDKYTSVIVTEYKEDMYPMVLNFHYAIVKEVMAAGPLGISVGPIAQWDS